MGGSDLLKANVCQKQGREYKTMTRASMLSDHNLRGIHTQMRIQVLHMRFWFAGSWKKSRDANFS